MRLTLFVFSSIFSVLLSACGTEPEPANDVTDALYESLRDSIIKEFEENELDAAFSDSLFAKVYDSVYQAEVLRLQTQYDSLTETHYDSLLSAQDSVATAQALAQDSIYNVRDSLQQLAIAASADSIYQALYVQIYEEIYTSSAAKNIQLLTLGGHYSYISPAIYPNLETLYGSEDPKAHLLTLTLTNRGTQTYYYIVVEAEVPGFTQVAITTEAINISDTITVDLTPAMIHSAWANLSSVANAQLNYKIKVLHNDKEVLLWSRTSSLEIWPANMHPVIYTRKDGASVDKNSSYAHWVQPQADSVQAVVESARMLHPDEKLVGYQDPSNSGAHSTITRAQVEAVYNALQARDIGYVKSASLGNAGQVVQFPNQTLRHRFANCIDGSVLFASALERIGIEVAIVSIPGHAFIGYRTWDDSNVWEFLETTLTWNNGGTFAQALAAGNAKYTSELNAGHFTDGTSVFTKITEARQLGYSAYPYDLEF